MKDFLVISDGSSEDELRFVCAESLASRFAGSFNVVATTELPPLPMIADAGGAGVYPPPDDGLRDAALARGAELKSAIERRFQKHSSPVTVFRVDETLQFIGRAVAQIARTHDLSIATLPTQGNNSNLCRSVVDGILIDGGRGVLGLPSGIACKGTFDRVTIAWNGSRECSRALSQAMPILTKAREVTVVLVDPTLRRAGAEFRHGDDIIGHLSRHEVQATLARVTSGELHTSEAILAEAARIETDLLVMGAQAEGGLLQWLQGSTSREVFAASPIPLLMAH